SLSDKKKSQAVYHRRKSLDNVFSSKTRILRFIPEYTKTVVRDFSSPRRPEYLEHGATFPQSLIEYLVDIFTRPREIVLDIFSGTGITLQASERLDRHSIGIELNPKYINLSRKLLGLNLKALEVSTNITVERSYKPKLIHDDCRNLKTHLQNNSIDFMVTSPPYANILHKVAKEAESRGTESVFRRRKEDSKRSLKDLRSFLDETKTTENHFSRDLNTKRVSAIPHPYSGDEKDLGNITDYNIFLDEIARLHKKVYDVLKPGRFAVWIVRDFRNVAESRYFIPYHCDLAEKAREIGYEYYDLWVWDQSKGRRTIHLGGGTAYYNSLTHSMIVILRKVG
ncbi:MAG: DNA methyltransferase, partial [Candidatus Hodarchaeota archaeon]